MCSCRITVSCITSVDGRLWRGRWRCCPTALKNGDIVEIVASLFNIFSVQILYVHILLSCTWQSLCLVLLAQRLAELIV